MKRVLSQKLTVGIGNGTMQAVRPRVSIKPVFGAMNSVIQWYHPREGDTPAQLTELINEVVQVSLRGVMK